MKYSLTELEKIKNKLEVWIKADREFLDDYQHFFGKSGKFYFHLRFPGIHLNAKAIELEKLWDVKTKKPLSDEQKRNIELICNKIVKLENRLKKIDQDILKIYLGDDFWGKRHKVILTHLIIDFAKNNFPKNKTLNAFHLKKLFEHLDKIPITYKEGSVKRILSRHDYSKSQRGKENI